MFIWLDIEETPNPSRLISASPRWTRSTFITREQLCAEDNKAWELSCDAYECIYENSRVYLHERAWHESGSWPHWSRPGVSGFPTLIHHRDLYESRWRKWSDKLLRWRFLSRRTRSDIEFGIGIMFERSLTFSRSAAPFLGWNFAVYENTRTCRNQYSNPNSTLSRRCNKTFWQLVRGVLPMPYRDSMRIHFHMHRVVNGVNQCGFRSVPAKMIVLFHWSLKLEMYRSSDR